MSTEEFFAEANRLNLRMLGTPEETRAALDLKDAEIARLRAELKMRHEHQHEAEALAGHYLVQRDEAREQVAAERERWEKQARAMHEAADAYGTGFYSGLKWRQHYAELRRMCGMYDA